VAERALIPLFPLGTVLYPGLLLPLHIFEERYRRLVRDLAERPPEEQRFGVVAIRQGREVGADGVEALHEVGCAAQVRRIEAYEDGRFELATTGGPRFRLVGVDGSLPYLQGVVEWLPEESGEAAAVLAEPVGRRFLAYRSALAGEAAGEAAGQLPDDPRVLSYLVAAAMILDLPDHQALLAAGDDTERLRLALRLLRREGSLLTRLPSVPGVEYTRIPLSPN
jgi:hypothetical protein